MFMWKLLYKLLIKYISIVTKKKSIHLFLSLVWHKGEIFSILYLYKPSAYVIAVNWSWTWFILLDLRSCEHCGCDNAIHFVLCKPTPIGVEEEAETSFAFWVMHTSSDLDFHPHWFLLQNCPCMSGVGRETMVGLPPLAKQSGVLLSQQMHLFFSSTFHKCPGA